MRLRTFNAPSMPEAMALVRLHLGAEAIILSTRRAGSSVQVTAALEQSEAATEFEPKSRLETAAEVATEALPPDEDPMDIVHEALVAHGTPARLVETLLAAAGEIATEEPILALAGALDAVFSFAPLIRRTPNKPLMLVGPPGAGKTIAVAKLATHSVIGGKKPRMISTDTVRAGGIAQLECFTNLLGLELHRAESAGQVAKLIGGAIPEELVLIDSGGINPYSGTDRAELAGFVAAARAEPVFVLPAGGDVFDAIEMAQAFRQLGSSRILVTRLDMVHRLGSLLAAADANRFTFCDAGLSPDVAEGLIPLNPVALARLLMPEATPAVRHKPETAS